MTNSERSSPDARGPAQPSPASDIPHAIDTLRQALRALVAGHQGAGGPVRTGPGGAETIEAGPAEVDATLARLPDDMGPAEVFARAIEQLSALVDADRAMLLLADGRGMLVPAAARGFRRDDPATIAVAPGEGLIGRALVEGRMRVRTDPSGSCPDDPFLARFPVRSAAVVPVRSGGAVVGVLYAGARRREQPFSAEQTLVLLAIADRVGAGLAHQRLAARASLHFERLRLLRSFAAETAVGRDLAVTLARACEMGTRLLDVSATAIALIGEDGAMVLRAAVGLPDALALGSMVAREGGALIRRALESATPAPCGDVRESSGADADFFAAAGLPSCLGVPLRHGEAVAGMLYLADVRVRQFAAEEVEVAQLLGALIGLAMANERLYGEARAAVDALASAQERVVESEKVRALGSMAGGVAHEFNNILAIILGKTQLLLARPQDDKTRESLGHVEEAAWRAADIVRRLQGFAAPAAGPAPGMVDVKTVVEDVLTLTRGVWRDEAAARGVRIDVVTDLEDTPLVPGHAAEIREALTNLVLNAVDAMPSGGQLRVAVRSQAAGVAVIVEDTGEGMPDHVRRLAFEPFFSTHSPLRTGLGLSVVHGVVARHGGRVDLASEAGQGTKVTMWLPGAGAPRVGTGPGTAPAPGASRGAVLVLEAEPTIRGILVDAIAEAGHRVEAAVDGHAGLARFQSERFDVVLVGLSLPERSGLEVARAVKSIRPGTAVVLITDWGNLVDPATLRDSGVDLILLKPFRLERVRAVLDDALRLRRRP